MSSYYRPKGLANFSGNCYMNSLIQCLYYCKDFRKKILEIDFNEENSMVNSLKELFNELLVSNYTSICPYNFKEQLNKNELFKNGIGSDAVDLLDFILSSIRNELTPYNSRAETVNYENKIYDKNEMLNEAKEDMVTKTLLDDIFMGIYEKEFKCEEGHCKYSFQMEYRIVFSLESISKCLKREELDLYDCFAFNYKYVENTHEKCYHNNCNKIMYLNEKIYENPKILIIILDRGYHKKYDKKVTFDLDINISDYIDKDVKNKCSSTYKLIGVSTHRGSTGKTGHYTSICLCDNDKYYLFNDKYVYPEKNENIIQDLETTSPYILFYRRVDHDNNPSKNSRNKLKRIVVQSKNNKEIFIEQIKKYLGGYEFSAINNTYNWTKEKNKKVQVNFVDEEINITFEERIQKINCCNLKTLKNKSSFALRLAEIRSYYFLNIFKEKYTSFFKSS